MSNSLSNAQRKPFDQKYKDKNGINIKRSPLETSLNLKVSKQLFLQSPKYHQEQKNPKNIQLGLQNHNKNNNGNVNVNVNINVNPANKTLKTNTNENLIKVNRMENNQIQQKYLGVIKFERNKLSVTTHHIIQDDKQNHKEKSKIIGHRRTASDKLEHQRTKYYNQNFNNPFHMQDTNKNNLTPKNFLKIKSEAANHHLNTNFQESTNIRKEKKKFTWKASPHGQFKKNINHQDISRSENLTKCNSFTDLNQHETPTIGKNHQNTCRTRRQRQITFFKIDQNNDDFIVLNSKKETCVEVRKKSKCPSWLLKNSESIFKRFKLEDFLILKQAGKGKYGKVFVCVHKKTGWLLALKELNKKALKEEQSINVVVQQIKICAYLKHPNIIQLYGCFEEQESVYLLMQYGPGGNLYEGMRKNQPDQDEILSIITNIYQAVFYLHGHDILHRDLKPENVLSFFGVYKLCDFGWAVYSRGQSRSTFCGTPLYISPEVLTGKDYDEKADVWGLGVLTYELIYGKVPFLITKIEDMNKIVYESVNYPKTLRIDIDLLNILQKMLSKQSSKRPTMNEIMSCHKIQNRLKEEREKFYINKAQHS